MIRDEFSRLIRQHRNAMQLSQQALADRCELSLRYIQELEAGTKQPTLTTLFQLSWGLETAPPTLIVPVWEKWRAAKIDS